MVEVRKINNPERNNPDNPNKILSIHIKFQ